MAQEQTVILTGGLNIANATNKVKPGEALMALNYEMDVEGDYSRVAGYERFDGQPKPSDFSIENFTDDEDFEAQMRTGIDAARALIQPVPGSGAVRGVTMFKDIIYSWRDSVDGQSMNMYKSTPTGWELIPTPTLSPSGRVEVVSHNFLANADGVKMYGCDGANKPFEFDGSTYTQITTPGNDFPSHIEVFSDHLFLGFKNGKLICSGLKMPLDYETLNGAAVWGLNGDIVSLKAQSGGAMAIFCSNRTEMIYGNNKDDFQKVIQSSETGAKEWSVQNLSSSIFLDDRGIAELNRTQAYGNFDYASISKKIRPMVKKFINRSIGSMIVRTKNQYRIFFDNGEGVIGTFSSDGFLGWTNFTIPNIGSCFYSGEDSTGIERLFMGSENGYVYEMDRGRSFDGESILSICRPVFMHQGQPSRYKHYFSIMLEMSVDDLAKIEVRPDYEYSSEELPIASMVSEVVGNGGYYDQARWDEFRYGEPVVNRQIMPITGDATSFSVNIVSESDFYLPHQLQALTIRYKFLKRVI